MQERKRGYLLYYREGITSINPGNAAEQLAGTGLEHVVPLDAPFDHLQTGGGPEGMAAGVCFAAVPQHVHKHLEAPHPICQVRESEQVWFCGDGYAVGYWKNRRPAPQDLERAEPIPGYEADLADGNGWTIPLVRLATGGSMLPRVMKRNRDGQIEYQALSKYQGICTAADEVYDLLESMLAGGEKDREVEQERHFSIAEQALQINYHVGPAEIAVLELLTTTNVSRVTGLLADLPGLLNIQEALLNAKKNSPPTGD